MKEEKISEPCVNLCVPCGEKRINHKAHKELRKEHKK
jgi:hypothetical protein